MARSPYSGVPEVSAELQAPDDYQHIQASPDAFGAPVAEGAQALGQGVNQAREFYGKVAADNATNNYLSQATAVLHGDPHKTVIGPDGQPAPDTGYFGLRGANAMDARQATSEHLDEIATEAAESLSDPQSRLEFENQSRRFRAQYDTQMAEHADTQQRVWATDTNNTSAKIWLANAGRDANNPIAAGVAQGYVRKAYRNNALLAGEDPQGAELKADQDVTLTRLRALTVTDPQLAKHVLTTQGGVLAGLPSYDQITHLVNSAVTDSVFAPNLDRDVNDAVAHAQARVGRSSDISDAIAGQEWSGKGPAPTSIDGAVGPSQILPATAVRYGLAANEAEAKAKLQDPAFATQARNTIIAQISALPNVQGDPARIAVGYFSGEGNIAPPGSPTPYIHDYKDGNGKSTSTYVSDVTGRMAALPSTADALNANLPQMLDRVRAHAEQLFPTTGPNATPNAVGTQDRYVQNFERRITQTITQQHAHVEVASHIVASALGGPNAPISEDGLKAVSPQVADAWSVVQNEDPYRAAGIRNRFDANARGRATGFGTNFKDYLDRALAPTTDPARIRNPMEFNNFVGPGEDAALTNTGADQLSSLISARGTPQGEAFASQAKAFMDRMHADITFSNAAAGRIDPKGEALFSKFAVQALPILMNANKNGTLAQVINPNSPDYLGNVGTGFIRRPAQMLKDKLDPLATQMGQMDEGSQGRYLLKDAVTKGRLSRERAAQIGEDLGYFKKGPSAPDKPDNPLSHITIQPQGYPGGLGPQ